MMGLSSPNSMVEHLYVLMIFSMILRIVNSAETIEAENTCKSEQCSNVAENILRYMNNDISPCENFYQFVCGNYKGDNVDDAGESEDSVWNDSAEFVRAMTVEILANNSDEEKNKPFSQAFDLFEACSDQDAMREQGLTPLKEILDEMGGWPVVVGDQWNEVRWEDAAGTLAKLGYEPGIFFNVNIVQDDGPTIQLTPTVIEEFDSDTWEKLTVVATKLGADPENLQPSSSNDHLHEFDENPSNSTVRLTIGEMSETWPSIDWMTYLTGVFAAVPNVTVVENQNVTAPPEYIDKLVEALKQNDPSVVMNYVSCKLVKYSIQYLSPEVASDSKSDAETEEESPTDARNHCATTVHRELPLIVEAIYEVNYVTDDLRRVTLKLSCEVKKQFNRMLNQATWIDTNSKELCKQKLQKLEFALGFPEDIKNGFYTDPYRGLEIDKNSYLRSMLNINKFKTTAKYEKALEPAKTNDDDYDDDDMDSDGRIKITSLNVSYNSDTNRISIMPGILHDPFMNKDIPMYVNYGGLGYIVGHEITHGYDSEEDIFLANYSEPYPPQERGKKKFRSNRRCMDNQYEKYMIDTWQIKINGSKWSKENIADDGGIKVAFHAYETYTMDNGLEPALPGLNYNPLQSFWIAFAHLNCGIYNRERVRTITQEDDHELHEFRVNSPLSNSIGFAETFNCPIGSSMNPKKKCFVW